MTPVLLQISFVAKLLTVGVGLTVMVKVCAVPVQLVPPLANVGVTVMVAVTGLAVRFVAVKAGIVGPVPVAARPMLVVLLVQA